MESGADDEPSRGDRSASGHDATPPDADATGAAPGVGQEPADQEPGRQEQPPLELAAGTVGPALLGFILIGFGLIFAESVPQLLFALVGLPAIVVGVIAQWQLPPYTTRLPVGVQAVLFVAIAGVSIVAGFFDDGFSPLGVVWLLSLAAFPDLLPARVRRWLRQSDRP